MFNEGELMRSLKNNSYLIGLALFGSALLVLAFMPEILKHHVVESSSDKQAKIAMVAMEVEAALNECPRPIAPARLTALWELASSMCPGAPYQQCPVSSHGAAGPLQHMPSSVKEFRRSGEDPNVLADAMKITVRHLCYARSQDGTMLDPMSDEAIMRYNRSPEYLRRFHTAETEHQLLWASIK
jgi:hypothetical protein